MLVWIFCGNLCENKDFCHKNLEMQKKSGNPTSGGGGGGEQNFYRIAQYQMHHTNVLLTAY